MLPYTKYKHMKTNEIVTNNARDWGGNLIRINDDLEEYFSEAMIYEVMLLWNDGYEIESIYELYPFFDPDEIFMILFHLSREGRTERPFTYMKKRKGRDIGAIQEIFSDAKNA